MLTCVFGFSLVLELDTHNMIAQAYNADRAIFPWQQCYSSFRLRLHAYLSFPFTVFPLFQVETGGL